MCHWKHLFDIFYNFLPEQSTSNWPSEHWQLPSNPQVPLPLQVVLGLQNATTNVKKVSKSTSKSENNEKIMIYFHN